MAKVQRIERFLAKVSIEPLACWIWTGAKGGVNRGHRYGVFYDGTKLVQAHRWSYEFFVGPIPTGLGLDHFKCERPECVNPWHVRPATTRENLLRGDTFQAANAAKTRCPQGHPYDETNTMLKKGHRICRACELDSQRRRRAKKAIAAGREPGRIGRPQVRGPKVLKGRPRGAVHPRAAFTEDQVAEIRRRYGNGELMKRLAAEFGVHRETISRLLKGTTYRAEEA